VRMLIDGQLRFSTSKIVLFRISVIKCSDTASAVCEVRWLLFVEMIRLPLLVSVLKGGKSFRRPSWMVQSLKFFAFLDA
jgi:hypothetical protein